MGLGVKRGLLISMGYAQSLWQIVMSLDAPRKDKNKKLIN
jgi:hypothetical protein